VIMICVTDCYKKIKHFRFKKVKDQIIRKNEKSDIAKPLLKFTYINLKNCAKRVKFRKKYFILME
jgi:hypothetical protein